MSKKSYDRGTAAIADEIQREQAESGGSQRAYKQAVHDKLSATIERQTTEIETLKNELARTRNAYQLRCAEKNNLAEELTEARKNAERYRGYWLDEHTKLINLDTKHRKLSAIVRTALTPDEYLNARKDIEYQYPEFKNQ